MCSFAVDFLFIMTLIKENTPSLSGQRKVGSICKCFSFTKTPITKPNQAKTTQKQTKSKTTATQMPQSNNTDARMCGRGRTHTHTHTHTITFQVRQIFTMHMLEDFFVFFLILSDIIMDLNCHDWSSSSVVKDFTCGPPKQTKTEQNKSRLTAVILIAKDVLSLKTIVFDLIQNMWERKVFLPC